jgi:DNA invertase Pin-like site-specific DNA recombinase
VVTRAAQPPTRRPHGGSGWSETGDVGDVSMRQPLLHDPRIVQLDRIKPAVAAPEPGELLRLPLVRKAFIYQRLSTHEQRKKSLWSLEMQDALREQATADGYREDQIVVERRDLGVSGTKGREERPGLEALIQAIEADEVEAVYVVHISSISRDQTLIDGLEFGELCKQHRVLIVMPTMRLNLRDAMHMRLYRQEIERAADEIELLKLRLGGPKRHKALSSRFDGRSVTPGYLVDHNLQSETYERYVLYPPQAEVVRAIFQAILAAGTPTRAARWLRDRGVVFPDFPPEVPSEAVTRCSLQRNAHPLRCPGGYRISPSLIRSIVTNPVYLGWWLVEGRVVSTDNHPPLVEEETFLLAQQVLAEHGRGARPRGGIRSVEPRLLSGLLWCARHEVPRRMGGSVNRGTGRYQCDDDYGNGQANHACVLLNAGVLDAPITDVILRHCQFVEHTEAVLAQLEAEYDTARGDAQRRQRERRRLQEEIDTLKQNLALTRTPEHVGLIFEQIDRRTERLQALADMSPEPGRPVLSAAQMATVRAFLADLRTGWDHQPPALRNEFLRLILNRVVITADRDHVEASIIWRAGAQQPLWIERPLLRRGGKAPWTSEDHAWLREHYATATQEALHARFPHRTHMAIRKQAAALGLKRPHKGVPKPKGTPWDEAESALLSVYAAGQLSCAELQAQLTHRTRDAIEHQARVLGLRLQRKPVYYRLAADVREIVSEGDSSRRG